MLTKSSKIRGYSDLFYAKVVRIQNYRIIAVDDYYGNTIMAREPWPLFKPVGFKDIKLNCKANDIILIGKINNGCDHNGNDKYRYNVLYKYSHEEIPELNIHYKWPNY